MRHHERTIRIVYIRKKLDLLVIEDYEQCAPASSRMKLRQEATQWEVYTDRKARFLELWEQVRRELLKNESVSESLFREYRDARAAFLVAHGALNEEFSKYAI